MLTGIKLSEQATVQNIASHHYSEYKYAIHYVVLNWGCCRRRESLCRRVPARAGVVLGAERWQLFLGATRTRGQGWGSRPAVGRLLGFRHAAGAGPRQARCPQATGAHHDSAAASCERARAGARRPVGCKRRRVPRPRAHGDTAEVLN